MRLQAPLIPSLIAVVTLLIAPMSAFAASPSPEASDTVLRIGVTNEPNTAALLGGCCAHTLQTALTYDQLVGKDQFGQPVPSFAESWSVSGDGLTWTFEIRPDMQWSDGEPADANDAAFTINYILESATSTNPIWNPTSQVVESATAPDPDTLVLTLKKPSSLPLTDRFLYIFPEHVYKDVKFEDLAIFGAEPPVVGTGPFILTEWVHGQYQRYVRNEHYWGGQPAISEILLQFYKSEDAAGAALKAGEIDITDAVSLGGVTDLASDAAIAVVDAPWSHFTPLIFNTRGAKEGPAYEGGPVGPGASTDALADLAFRDALGYAIDHQALVDKVLDGHGKPGLGPVAPSDTVNFTGLPGVARTFDPELAKQKLETAGYVDSNGDGTREDKSGKELNLEVMISSSTPTNGLSAQFLAEWFRQVGVGLTATSLDEASAFDRYYGNDFDLFVASFRPDVNGRMSFFSGEGDAVGWVSPQYNDLLARLDAATDPAERKELTASLDQLIYTDGPWDILYYPNLVQAYRADRISGWEASRAADLPIVTDDMFVAPVFTGLAPVAAAEPSASAGAPSAGASAGSSAAPGSSDATSGSSTLPIAVGAMAIVAIIGVIVLRRRRSGGPA